MVVIVVESVSPRLRGHLRRFLVEVATGVYVGRIPARVRERLWDRVVSALGPGRALIVRPAANEQGFVFDLAGWTDRELVDLDGFQLSRILTQES